jgi:hypothetical protein
VKSLKDKDRDFRVSDPVACPSCGQLPFIYRIRVTAGMQRLSLQAPTCLQVRSSSLLSLDDALYRPSHPHTALHMLSHALTAGP